MPDMRWTPSRLLRAGRMAAYLPLAREAYKTLGPVVSPAVQSARDRVVASRASRRQARGLVDGSWAAVYVGSQLHYVVWAGDDPVNAFPPLPAGADLGRITARVDLAKRRRPDVPRRWRRRRGGGGEQALPPDASDPTVPPPS